MEIILMFLLFIAGYVVILQEVLQRAGNSGQHFVISLILFLIYTCGVGAFAALTLAFGDLGLVLYVMLILIGLVEIYVLCAAIKNVRWQIEAKYVLYFIAYLVVLLIVTLFSREQRPTVILETDIMAPLRAARNGSMEELYHMILNMCLFVPLGYLFTQIHPWRLGKLGHVLGVGVLVSTIIESCQMLLRLGNCDVCDILANTVGVLVGMVVYNLFRTRR